MDPQVVNQEATGLNLAMNSPDGLRHMTVSASALPPPIYSMKILPCSVVKRMVTTYVNHEGTIKTLSIIIKVFSSPYISVTLAIAFSIFTQLPTYNSLFAAFLHACGKYIHKSASAKHILKQPSSSMAGPFTCGYTAVVSLLHTSLQLSQTLSLEETCPCMWNS